MKELFMNTQRLGFSIWSEKDISDALEFLGLLKKLGFKYIHDEFYPPTGLYHPSYQMTKHDYMAGKVE